MEEDSQGSSCLHQRKERNSPLPMSFGASGAKGTANQPVLGRAGGVVGGEPNNDVWGADMLGQTERRRNRPQATEHDPY